MAYPKDHLGPILFLIYISDLDSDVMNWILKFADDTNIFGKVNTAFDALNFHLVGAQLCRLSPIDAHTVALKPVMGK